MKRSLEWLTLAVLVSVVRAEEAFRDDPVKSAATTTAKNLQRNYFPISEFSRLAVAGTAMRLEV